MGNVLDCSADPLDQIHEPDGNQPTEVGPTGSDDARSQSSSYQGSIAGGDRRSLDGAERPSQQQPPRPEVVYLEKGVPLRNSIMWKLQREYYLAHHVQCWEKMVVPCFVTSNSFIARAYARVLVGFMRDWFLFSGEADQSEPILIVEIGAGHGKFSCLVLQHLLEMREFLPTVSHKPGGVPAKAGNGDAAGEGASDGGGEGERDGGAVDQGEGGAAPPPSGDSEGRAWQRRDNGAAGDGLPFRYVVTDVAQGTLDYVRSHPSMQAFLTEGIMEVALMDAEAASPPSELLLQVSGQVVDLKLVKNPVATVCNYVFDSLRQDAFRVKDSTLYENRVTITAAKPLPRDLSKLSLTALQGLALRWEHRPHAVPAERARAYYAGAAAEKATAMVREREGRSATLPAFEEDGIPSPPQRKSTSGTDGNAEDGLPTNAPGLAVEGEEAETSADVEEDEEGVGVGAAMNGGIDESSGPGAGVGGGGEGGVEGGRRGDGGTGASDGDFDELLASYLVGSDRADGGGRGAGREGEGEGERGEDQGRDIFGKAGGSLLMPLGALRLLRHLSSLSGGRGLVLVGDKGYVSAEEMKGDRDPHIAYHGSLSCMVNMDALKRYTRQRGGWSLSSPYMEGFKCQALAFGMEETGLQETRFAFQDSTRAFGPESFSTLQRSVKDDVATPSLGLVVQLLRLSRLDPDVFIKFRATLVDQVSSQDLPPPIWEDLKKDTAAIARQSYPLQQGKDVNFEAARLLMALKDYEAALVLFRRSDSVSGEHHVTCHNMGMSYFYLGKLKEAKECFERSLELDETYEDSVRWLAHVERSLVPPSLAAATAAARSSVVELRDAAPITDSGAGGGSRTAAGLVDVSLNNLSI